MMPPRSVGGRLSGHSTRRMYVRQLGWLFSNKLEMRLSAWGMQFALPVMIVASIGECCPDLRRRHLLTPCADFLRARASDSVPFRQRCGFGYKARPIDDLRY